MNLGDTKLAKASTSPAAKRSEKIDVISTPDRAAGNALVSAWRGVYHLFDGRWDNVEIGPDGVNVIGFSTSADYDPNQIVNDISHRGRRLDFLDVYPLMNGQIPAEFTSAKELSTFTTQNFRDSVETGSARSPKYVRDAVAALKADLGIAKKRGPRRKNFSMDSLGEIDVEALKKADPQGIAHLKEMLEALMESSNSTTAESETVSATS